MKQLITLSALSLLALASAPAGAQSMDKPLAPSAASSYPVAPAPAWLFGSIADRHGRRLSLMISVLLMCFGSALIAVTPTNASIGIAAPALLLFARMLQGLSLGGEYGASATYLSEMAHPESRGFYSSFQYVTLIAGQLSAMLVLILLQKVFLTQAEIEDWGWRIPFFIGALAALGALWLRRTMVETESFAQLQARGDRRRGRLRELLRHPRELATVAGLTMGGTLAFYTFTTYMQKFLVNTVGFAKDTATLVSAASLVGFMLLQPLVGALSDRIGRRPILIGFGIAGTLGTVPLMSRLAVAQEPWEALALILLALAVVSGYSAINAVVKAELFPVEVRALGVGLPYAITVSLFGGTAEYVALWFKQAGNEAGFYWYVSACIACSLLVYLAMPDTRRTSRIDRD